MQIPLSRPDLDHADLANIEGLLTSGVLALGPSAADFEARTASFVGTRHAVAVNSGTSALHLIVRSMGISDGDEVITTPFSFVSSSNCILYERARPVFVDVEPETGNLNPALIESAITRRTKAILPVDVFGHPARLDVIRDIARRHGLKVIEDSCEALGSEYKGRKTGHPDFCDAAAFGFYPNKQITTGEGGMIVTSDDRIADLCRSMRNQGRPIGVSAKDPWLVHERLGFNYRMDELSAALGVAQMKRIEEIIQKREQVARLYGERLSRIPGVRLPYVGPEVTRMSWFVYVIRVGLDQPTPEKQRAFRDRVMNHLIERGVGCRPYFMPIHLQPFYREMFGYKEGDFPVAEMAGRTGLAIPFHNRLTADEVDYVATVLEEALAAG